LTLNNLEGQYALLRLNGARLLLIR